MSIRQSNEIQGSGIGSKISPENQSELKRLARAIDFSDGFSLFFAVCNSPAYREKLVRSIKELTSRLIVEIELEKAEPFDPCDQLSIKLRNAPENCTIFVYGLEKLIPSEPDDFGLRILSALNLRRSCFQKLDRPIVFWIPEYLETLIATRAPDFWDWRSETFRFSAPEEAPPAQLGEILPSSVDNLTLAEKKSRISHLESLYVEYSGSEEPASKLALANVALKLGELYMSLGRYDDAGRMFQEALQLSKEIGRRDLEASALLDLGNLAYRKGKYDEAREYYKKALEIFEQLNQKANISATLVNLGNLANDLNKPELAFRFTTIALFMFVSMEHADAQKAGKNLVLYAQKLGFDEEKAEAEFKKVVQEFNQRGYELVDELLRELEDAVG